MEYERYVYRRVRRFAWLPVRMSQGYWVWLTHYTVLGYFAPNEDRSAIEWNAVYKHDNA